MATKHQIAFPAVLESLTSIQNFVDDACAQAQLSSKVSYDIKLAVDEACMNIIDHGYEGMDPGSVVVSLQYGTQQVVIHITDFGPPFEPVEPAVPDPEVIAQGLSDSGFGLYFIYRSVDSVNYEATESGNTLTFIKKLKQTEDE